MTGFYRKICRKLKKYKSIKKNERMNKGSIKGSSLKSAWKRIICLEQIL